MFVDSSGEAAFGYVTKVKGRLITLKPSEQSTITATKHRKYLSVMEQAKDIKIGDNVLVYQSDSQSLGDDNVKLDTLIPEGNMNDKFKYLSVLKVTKMYDDSVSKVCGENRKGIELTVPSSHVFKLPEDWPWLLAAELNSESGLSEPQGDCVKQEEWWDQFHQAPQEIDSYMELESSGKDISPDEPKPRDSLLLDPQSHDTQLCETHTHSAQQFKPTNEKSSTFHHISERTRHRVHRVSILPLDCFSRASRIYGEWGFMGFIITHKSEWGFMGIYG